jgi:two-component system, chemotaxis family, chemotaxis protein CheY
VTHKLLLVDDSGLARRSMRAILETAGYEVVEAEDGMTALERYYLEKPDLVLLDLVMKGMYGLDVLTKLRELDPAARVIIVSADVQRSSQDLVKAAGAAGFINKPVGGPRVLALVRGLLERSES